MPHTGGQTFKPGDELYQTVLRWLQDGAQADKEKVASVVRLEMYPKQSVLEGKGAKQQIQVSLATFRGRTFGDLRLFVLKDGDWIPTQRGCTVDLEQLEELEEVVVKLRNTAEHSTRPF